LISREKRKKTKRRDRRGLLIPDLFSFFQFLLSFSFLLFSTLAPVGVATFFFSVFTIIMGFAEQPAKGWEFCDVVPVARF